MLFGSMSSSSSKSSYSNCWMNRCACVCDSTHQISDAKQWFVLRKVFYLLKMELFRLCVCAVSVSVCCIWQWKWQEREWKLQAHSQIENVNYQAKSWSNHWTENWTVTAATITITTTTTRTGKKKAKNKIKTSDSKTNKTIYKVLVNGTS